MCGRFNVTDAPMVIALMDSLGFDTSGLKPHFYQDDLFNIAPTDHAMVAVQEELTKFFREMRWWLTPSWAPEVTSKYSMFNAKAETIETSRAFKGPFQHRRAIIPASGFIEWKTENGVKQPYYIKPESGLCFFGGVWDVWEKDGNHLESFAIITTEASPSFQHLHSRMPVLLNPEQFDQWLSSNTPLTDIRPMLTPRELSNWEYLPLNTAVNNSRNKSKQAAEPIGKANKFDTPS
ncbi:SOS response-associated peptidase [Hahella sp. HN01]|uniref:SOS response-associated peptidase n=1 Tax=Hahella sp. HN01 TaxID=2847262 RepID=UPI001C1EFE25|nr:SOS response-associated peptidase [Hahella sp. HN01]MBU6955942.1 SOS response-associated peptidase [Hahella sp. HN01]